MKALYALGFISLLYFSTISGAENTTPNYSYLRGADARALGNQFSPQTIFSKILRIKYREIHEQKGQPARVRTLMGYGILLDDKGHFVAPYEFFFRGGCLDSFDDRSELGRRKPLNCNQEDELDENTPVDTGFFVDVGGQEKDVELISYYSAADSRMQNNSHWVQYAQKKALVLGKVKITKHNFAHFNLAPVAPGTTQTNPFGFLPTPIAAYFPGRVAIQQRWTSRLGHGLISRVDMDHGKRAYLVGNFPNRNIYTISDAALTNLWTNRLSRGSEESPAAFQTRLTNVINHQKRMRDGLARIVTGYGTQNLDASDFGINLPVPFFMGSAVLDSTAKLLGVTTAISPGQGNTKGTVVIHSQKTILDDFFTTTRPNNHRNGDFTLSLGDTTHYLRRGSSRTNND